MYFKAGATLGIGIFQDNIFATERKIVEMAKKLIEFPKAQNDEVDRIKQRSSTRINVSLPVSFRLRKFRSQWQRTQTTDISQAGVRLALPADVKAGQCLDLEIKLPESDDIMQMTGVVVWKSVPRHERDKYVDCGVAFENLKKVKKHDKLTYFVADKLCHFALDYVKAFEVKPVGTFDEFKNTCHLLYAEYRKRSYCPKRPTQLHYTPHVLLPDSQTFVLMRSEKTVGTISLIVDSPLGVPMESLYPNEITQLRDKGCRLAEVGLLCLDSSYFGKSFYSLTYFEKQACLFRLFKVMFNYARLIGGVTDLIIAVHPKHESLYKYFGMKPFGPVKSYPAANGNLALPLHLNIQGAIDHASVEVGPGYFFLQDIAPNKVLQNTYQPTVQHMREWLGMHLPLWDRMNPEEQEHFKTCYPGL